MKRICCVATTLLLAMTLLAQSIDQVTLVVSSDGVNKEDATQKALRSAVEQAYGVFVSANTEILNDELVKDEIATVSSGNIESYKELSSSQLPAGGFFVSLQVVVSTKKLTAYAQSKGTKCEFAGATFGANLKLAQLNSKNTELAFNNLIEECKALIPYCFDVELETGTPTADGELPISLSYYSNENTFALVDHILSTLNALKLSYEQAASLQEIGAQIGRLFIYRAKYFPGKAENSEFSRWKTEASYDSNRQRYIDPIQYGGYFYSPFPMNKLYKTFKENLPDIYVMDNLENSYELNEIKHDPIICTDESVRRWGGSIDDYNACFYMSDYTIMLPRLNIVKKKKVYSYKSLIGEQKTYLYIPVETLMNISSFEVKLRTK